MITLDPTRKLLKEIADESAQNIVEESRKLGFTTSVAEIRTWAKVHNILWKMGLVADLPNDPKT